MTSNFDSHNSNQQPTPAENHNQASRSLDVVQRDRFEMLSAYLDGEVTAEERRQVEDWLANDPTVQKLHTRLLSLRQAFQTMPIPVSDERAVQQTVNAVLARVDRGPRLSVIWGGIAIAAVAVGAVSSLLLGERSPLGQFATNPTRDNTETVQADPNSEPLMIALDKPLVSIPKNPVADPENPNQTLRESNDNIR